MFVIHTFFRNMRWWGKYRVLSDFCGDYHPRRFNGCVPHPDCPLANACGNLVEREVRRSIRFSIFFHWAVLMSGQLLDGWFLLQSCLSSRFPQCVQSLSLIASFWMVCISALRTRNCHRALWIRLGIVGWLRYCSRWHISWRSWELLVCCHVFLFDIEPFNELSQCIQVLLPR
jgi:hypothetical protein